MHLLDTHIHIVNALDTLFWGVFINAP